MKTIRIKGHKVELYDSIEDLPIVRFHKYNKMLLIDSGIGSDLADFDRHIEKAMRYAAGENPQLTVAELQNMRQNIYFVQSNISPRYLSFAVLVKSIDGKQCNDLSDDALKRIVDMLSDVPQGELTANLAAVKKKIDDELRLYFPKVFDDAALKEYYDRVKERMVLQLQAIITGEDNKRIDDLAGQLVTFFRPQSFSGNDSVEIQHDKNFESMCLTISQNLNAEPKKMTVLEFYNAFEYLKEAAKKQNRKNAQNKPK